MKPLITLLWSQIDCEKPNAVYIHARFKSGGVAAQLRLEVSEKAGWVGALFVEENHRKKGLASLLLYRAFAICKRLGFETIGLVVHNDNQDARRLYRKLGFVGFTDGHEGYQQFIKVL
jgi:GNAT superfamily N-acetyltransferase